MRLNRAIEAFWRQHRRASVVPVLLYFAILALVTICAAGPQSEPFIYQAH